MHNQHIRDSGTTNSILESFQFLGRDLNIHVRVHAMGVLPGIEVQLIDDRVQELNLRVGRRSKSKDLDTIVGDRLADRASNSIDRDGREESEKREGKLHDKILMTNGGGWAVNASVVDVEVVKDLARNRS